MKTSYSASNLIVSSLLFFFLFLMQGNLVFALSPSESVQNLLEGRHWTLDAEAFQKIQGAEPVLMQIAEDPSTINYKRFRALSALSVYSTEAVAAFLANYVTQHEAQAPLARRALDSFSKGFARTHPQQVQKLAQKLLRHQNGTLRITAARILKQSNPVIFERFIKSEKQTWVRKAAQE